MKKSDNEIVARVLSVAGGFGNLLGAYSLQGLLIEGYDQGYRDGLHDGKKEVSKEVDVK